jgi:hypothetical protein
LEKKEIIYFKKPGPANTGNTIQQALKKAKELGIDHMIVASTRGQTALEVCEALNGTGIQVICVAEHSGFAGQDTQLLPENARKELEGTGAKILITSHILSGIERSLSKKFGGISPVEIIAHTLRQFGGEGIKVAVEITVMAADAGLIPTDREIIAIAGTWKGADTAVVLKAAHMNNFFDLEIREIIAKPRQRKA